MSRQIVTGTKTSGMKAAGASPPPKDDPYATIVLKLIPAEFVSVYLAVFNLIKTYQGKADNSALQWIVFAAMVILLPFYLRWTSVKSWKQTALTVLSFLIWVFTLGGPWDGTLIGGYPPQFLGSILLPIYTLCIPALYKQIESTTP